MKTLITFFSIFCISLLQAQITTSKEAKVTKGSPYNSEETAAQTFFINRIYFNKGNEILQVMILEDAAVTLQKSSTATLSVLNVKKYTDFPKQSKFEAVKEINGRYYFFYSVWKKPNDELFYREIDFDKGEFIGTEKLLIKTDEKIPIMFFESPAEGKVKTYRYMIVPSQDHSKILIYYRLRPQRKLDKFNYDNHGMHVFDSKLNKIWNKDITMPHTEKLMDNIKYAVDSEGNCYISANVSEEDPSSAKLIPHTEIITIKAVTGELKNHKVNLANINIIRPYIYDCGKEYMICAGFYSNEPKSSIVEGGFTFKIQKNTGKVYDHKTYKIPENQTITDKKDQDTKYYFDFTDLLFQQDGTMLLIGEEHFASLVKDERTYTLHSYRRMVVCKIDPKGDRSWIKVLNKRQSAPGQLELSYKYMFLKGKHYFIFCDHPDNQNLKHTDLHETYRYGLQGLLAAYVIEDVSGTVSKLAFFDIFKFDDTRLLRLVTNRIVPTKEGFVTEFYKRKKEDIMIKVDILK